MIYIKYVACIMCGKTVALNRFNAEPFDIDPSDYRVLQVREQVGGRRGQGFFNVEGEGKTIIELSDSADPTEREVAEVLKQRLLSVIKSYLDSGFLSQEEITSL